MPVLRSLWMLPLAAAALSAAPALADEDRPKNRPGRVIAHVDPDRVQRSWLTLHLDRVHVQKKRGFAYTRSLEGGERGMELRLSGPVVGRKKTVGLGFELRF